MLGHTSVHFVGGSGAGCATGGPLPPDSTFINDDNGSIVSVISTTTSATNNGYFDWVTKGASAAAASVMRLTNGGFLGIGTTTPYSMLSVAGQVVAKNYVATSTATSSFAGGLKLTGGGLTSATLTSCDTIDTDSSGNFKCGVDSGTQLPTYIVKASGGDFTTIQGALDACGTTGGGSIYLLDASYSQGATGLLWKGSNCNIYGKGYGTTTINFTGATTGFKTNLPSGVYAHNGVHNVVILGDGTAKSIAINMGDMSHQVYDGIQIDNWDTGVNATDTHNTTFYNKITNFDFTTIKSFGINASSTNPVNDNIFENGFIGCSNNTGCIAINLNNAQANKFDNVTTEPAGTTNTQCVQIRSSGLATNNGTFQNEFNHFYCEGATRGVYASSTDNRSGSAPVFGNNFYGGQIETNTVNSACEDAGCKEVGFYGTGLAFVNTNQTGIWTILAKNLGTMLTISDQGFSNMALLIQNTVNFAHNSLDYIKFALLNVTDTSNLLTLNNAGSGNTIIATSTKGSFIVDTMNRLQIGTTTNVATDFLAATTTANATTSVAFGKQGQNKGTCMTLYRTDGTAIYAFVAAGATAFTLTATKPAGCQN